MDKEEEKEEDNDDDDGDNRMYKEEEEEKEEEDNDNDDDKLLQIFLRNFAHFSVKYFALWKKVTFFYAKYCRKIFNAKITAKVSEKI